MLGTSLQRLHNGPDNCTLLHTPVIRLPLLQFPGISSAWRTEHSLVFDPFSSSNFELKFNQADSFQTS